MGGRGGYYKIKDNPYKYHDNNSLQSLHERVTADIKRAMDNLHMNKTMASHTAGKDFWKKSNASYRGAATRQQNRIDALDRQEAQMRQMLDYRAAHPRSGGFGGF